MKGIQILLIYFLFVSEVRTFTQSMVMQIFQEWLKGGTLPRNNIFIHSIDGDLGVTDHLLKSADLYVMTSVLNNLQASEQPL